MAKVVISIGIPGAGKTTVLKELAEENGYYYVSTDGLRAEMFKEVEDRTSPEKESLWAERNKEVWDEAKKRVKEFIGLGETVVFDATFSNSEKRKEFIEFAKHNGAEKIQGIFIDTPLEVAKERNQKRGRNVREIDIERMAKELKENEPKIEEGFDGIFTLNEYRDLIMVEVKKGEGSLRKEFR